MYDHLVESYANINIMFAKNLKLLSDIGALKWKTQEVKL